VYKCRHLFTYKFKFRYFVNNYSNNSCMMTVIRLKTGKTTENCNHYIDPGLHICIGLDVDIFTVGNLDVNKRAQDTRGRCYDNNFRRFSPLFAKNIGVFLNQCYDSIFLFALFCTKNANISANFLAFFLQIITFLPDVK
jgi:hypothetical protein